MPEEEKRTLVAKEEVAETCASSDERTQDEEDVEQPVRPRLSPWRRLALITFVLVFAWFTWAWYKHVSRPKVIYADRYSDEFKYRPAASPIITEILKDGRMRLRGAVPTHR
ncbi:hypothetical protein DAEQUDRAFT_762008 [Daedalea quercina L-15889]|uniref:Uncharacterized protein n=1 Tax=Daedalea quercina L-15889 TaxID=1314783 RepID=A0A165TJV1_9APHY|nr:hypothetical protein DAEQUDRAFT_762008 [Daedalea quercina L-15889]